MKTNLNEFFAKWTPSISQSPDSIKIWHTLIIGNCVKLTALTAESIKTFAFSSNRLPSFRWTGGKRIGCHAAILIGSRLTTEEIFLFKSQQQQQQGQHQSDGKWSRQWPDIKTGQSPLVADINWPRQWTELLLYFDKGNQSIAVLSCGTFWLIDFTQSLHLKLNF